MRAPQSSSVALLSACLCAMSLGLGAAACDDKVPEPTPKLKADPTSTPEPADVIIEDLEPGSGDATVEKGDKLKVYYEGRVKATGAVFDAKKEGEEPFGFTVGQGVIEGWSKGVLGMKIGGKRKLTIPSKMAYGAEGRPGKIPPNATLVFDIQLLEIEGKGAPADAGDGGAGGSENGGEGGAGDEASAPAKPGDDGAKGEGKAPTPKLPKAPPPQEAPKPPKAPVAPPPPAL